MNQAALRNAFEEFLRSRSLKFTAQRARIFDRAFATHEHFTAETLFRWLEDEGAAVSRATVYRTLGLLVEGRFLESLDTGRGELLYEHVLGHRHHDHMVCLECGRIEEFFDERIEQLQEEAAEKKGFVMLDHDLRLLGFCKACARKRLSEGLSITELPARPQQRPAPPRVLPGAPDGAQGAASKAPRRSTQRGSIPANQ